MSGAPAAIGFRLMITMRLRPGPGERRLDAQAPVAPPSTPVPPRTILVKRSVDPDKGSATFIFKSSTAGSRYRCQLDRSRYRPCRSPKTYRHLAAGRHTFKVVAVNGAGIADPTPLVARIALPKR